jgi:ATP-dependent Zn protease
VIWRLSKPDSRRAAAVHEAGHAVVAWAVGLKVQQLCIGEDGKGASCIECSAHLPVLDQIAIAAAGMEAVELLNAPTWELVPGIIAE